MGRSQNAQKILRMVHSLGGFSHPMVLVAYHFGKLRLTGNASTFAEYGDPELLSKENNIFVVPPNGF